MFVSILTSLLPSFLLFVFSLLLIQFFFYNILSSKNPKSTQSEAKILPKPYPIIGHLIAFSKQKSEDTFDWLSGLVVSSPSSTFVVHLPFGRRSIYTANPATVEHVLKTNSHIYQKGPHHKTVLRDVFGDSIITLNGEAWKFQRHLASHVFTPKSLQNYVENIVDFELNERLIPILTQAAKNRQVIDLQHILQRFTFDNICTIAFGYDPAYLSPSLPRGKFSDAFDDAILICFTRFTASFPVIWKLCRFLNIGQEKRLKTAVQEIREFASSLVQEKRKQGLESSRDNNNNNNNNNLLLRLLKCDDELDEKLIIDIVTTFIFAGRDPTSAGLTWFFWLLHKNKQVEQQVINEIDNNSKIGNYSSVVEEIKDMTYTHAALCETMRLYPPVPMDTKQAAEDDVLPDGTKVKKGMLVNYVMYAMGRSERLWGLDWAEFRPERWLEKEEKERKWRFVPRDSYTYPVFNAGARICLGKEMAFLQMKRVIAGVLSRFRVVPVVEEGFEPVYVASMTAKMHGGFRVRIQERVHDNICVA